MLRLVPRRAPWTAVLGCLLGLAATGCDGRAPCRKLADRDCDRHGESSSICRDERERAATADPFLSEVCRKELEGNASPRPLR
jgi:hypothetical protein